MTIEDLKSIRYDEQGQKPPEPKFRRGQMVMREMWAKPRRIASRPTRNRGGSYTYRVDFGAHSSQWYLEDQLTAYQEDGYVEDQLTAYQEDERLSPHPTWISKELLADAWPHEQQPPSTTWSYTYALGEPRPQETQQTTWHYHQEERQPTTTKKATDMTTITLKLNKDEQDAARNDDWDFIHNKIRSALPPHLERVYVGQQFADGERTYKVEHLGPKSDGEPSLALCSVDGRGSEQFTVVVIRGRVAAGSWVEVSDESE